MRDDDLLKNVPPHDGEAEIAVLGAMVQSRDAATHAVSVLKRDDFYRPAYAAIFEAAAEVVRRSDPLDILTLEQELRSRGTYDTAAAAWRTSADLLTCGHSDVAHQAKRVRDYARLRSMLSELDSAKRDIFESRDPAQEILDRVEARVFAVTHDRSSQDPVLVGKLLPRFFAELERGPDESGAVRTGYADLDDAVAGGFLPGELVLVGARAGVGKTTIQWNVARNLVLERRTPPFGAAFFSLERSEMQLVKNLLASLAEVDTRLVRRCALTNEHIRRLMDAGERVEGTSLYVDATPAPTVQEIQAKARRLRADRERPIHAVFIDYLQLLRGHDDGRKARYEVLGDVSRALKRLAGELQVVVVAAVQLNRESEKRQSKRPLLSDLRESGNLEQDADTVLLAFEDEEDNPDREAAKESSVLTIAVAKNRHGSTPDVKLRFEKRFSLLKSMEDPR